MKKYESKIRKLIKVLFLTAIASILVLAVIFLMIKVVDTFFEFFDKYWLPISFTLVAVAIYTVVNSSEKEKSVTAEESKNG